VVVDQEKSSYSAVVGWMLLAMTGAWLVIVLMLSGALS
jgi:hypothetical protein